MYLVPWIISGVLAISLVYTVWLHRKASTLVSAKETNTVKILDMDSISDIVRATLKPHGYEIQKKITDPKSLESVLFDGILGIKERIEDAKYVETIARLEPILHDLESLASAKWATKEVIGFISNTIQLIEYTFGISRINDESTKTLENPRYWANYDPSEIGLVQKRYSPWVYGDETIIQGVLQRMQDASQ